MAKTETAGDPLTGRVREVVALVRELRVRVTGLEDELATARSELEQSRQQVASLESSRGKARLRVERALELIHG